MAKYYCALKKAVWFIASGKNSAHFLRLQPYQYWAIYCTIYQKSWLVLFWSIKRAERKPKPAGHLGKTR
jgi:hypothetical protein